MSSDAYELLALAMRYVFAGLIVLIVLRGWRMAVKDSARARALRRLSPSTGIIGKAIIVAGDTRTRIGMSFPLTLEGTIGASKRADIRIKNSSIRPRHAYYQMTDKGLYLRGHASAIIIDASGRAHRELTVMCGEEIVIGRVRIRIMLTGKPPVPRYNLNQDDIFETSEIDIDALFMSNPAARSQWEE